MKKWHICDRTNMPKYFCLINAHIRANGVVIGIVVSALVIVGDDIGLGRIGFEIGEDIVDLILGWVNTTKIVEGWTYVLSSIHSTKTSVGSKNSLDNRGIRRRIEVSGENVRERRLADILEQKCRLNDLRGSVRDIIKMHVVKAEWLIASTVDQLSANENARTIALPHSVQSATREIFL